MPSTLVPLNFKPGIQRDGTAFQPNYCTDGNWIRFQRGKVRTMGGISNGGDFALSRANFCSDILITPNTQNQNRIFIYISTLDYILKTEFQLEPFQYIRTIGQITPTFNNHPNLKWQSEVIVNPLDKQKYVVFLGTNNGADINQNSASLFYYGLDQDTQGTALQTKVIDAEINGGMCFSSPFLFLYGSNGKVLYSKSNDPFDFTINPTSPASAGQLLISNDKVIWGRPVRGGSNSPAILFWTSSSVVRITNVGDTQVNFKIDVIAKGTSILSTRCVVEYDGLFFWPGTDRFYVYNGIVQEMVNTMNLNYFYDNLNMNRRQETFGMKYPKFGEIWWTFPTGNVQSLTVIYNKGGNFWFDVQLEPKSCGMFYEEAGKMLTFGSPKASGEANTGLNYIWMYETTKSPKMDWFPGNNRPRRQDNIQSYFYGPTISWAAFDPRKSEQNTDSGPVVDRWVDLQRIEPDFKFSDDDDGEIQVGASIKKYAQSANTGDINLGTIDRDTEKLDIRLQGRHIVLSLGSIGNFFEMGNVLLLLGIGDGQ